MYCEISHSHCGLWQKNTIKVFTIFARNVFLPYIMMSTWVFYNNIMADTNSVFTLSLNPGNYVVHILGLQGFGVSVRRSYITWIRLNRLAHCDLHYLVGERWYLIKLNYGDRWLPLLAKGTPPGASRPKLAHVEVSIIVWNCAVVAALRFDLTTDFILNTIKTH